MQQGSEVLNSSKNIALLSSGAKFYLSFAYKPFTIRKDI